MAPDLIEEYCKKSGDSSVPDGNLEENEHGFCVWRLENKAFILVAVFGDGKYWNEWAEIKAKEVGMKTIVFATKRKPDGFVRNHGFTVTGYVLSRAI